MLKRVLLILLLTLHLFPSRVDAQTRANAPTSEALQSRAGSESLEELLADAQNLFIARKPIDARSKLLKALELAPNDYRPHMHLGEYYLLEVAHFRLAHRYLRKAEELFEKTYGTDFEGMMQTNGPWQNHANLVYLLAEARLNLDNYEGALATLDRFGKLYWRNSYPGTRAWVLMKLKRVDEAVRVAQAGLLRGAESGRTFNILGILLSVKHQRELSLDAFARAIRAERLLGEFGQPATPLNNAGEVYRELFQDDFAEASWVQALSHPDGCDHILPSLNLANLYMDELRLFQAERVLDDFEACFAERSIRSDTEHRGLIAMARGRLALRFGEPAKAIDYLYQALERQQWFGKIGTNANDVQFAVLLSLAQASLAKAEIVSDRAYPTIAKSLQAKAEIPWLRLRAWWLNRRARNLAIDELDGIEDLEIRNTDTMLEYPTFGVGLAGLPYRALQTHVERITESDKRDIARAYYDVYLGTNLLVHGDEERAIQKFLKSQAALRTIDRMIRAEVLAKMLKAEKRQRSFWHARSQAERRQNIVRRSELFALLPSHLRYHGLRLPVEARLATDDHDYAESIADHLLQTRFEDLGDEGADARYRLVISTHRGGTGDTLNVFLEEKSRGSVIAQQSGTIPETDEEEALFINTFLDSVFRHRVDPAPAPLPKLGIIGRS